MPEGFGAPPFAPPLPEQQGATSPTVSHTVDMVLLKTEVSHTVDMVLLKTESKTHTVDQVLQPPPLTHTVDMVLETSGMVTHTVDMILKGTSSPDHTVDMILQATVTKDHTVDQVLLLQPQKTHTVDQILKGVGLTKSHTVDQHITGTVTTSHTVDMVLLAPAVETKTHTVDMVVAPEITRVHTVDMIVEDHRVATFTETVSDWTETTFDSNYDWDQVWLNPKDVRRFEYPHGVSWFAKAGNGLRMLSDDLSHPTLSQAPGKTSDIWYGLGYDSTTNYETEFNQPDRFRADKRLFVDNDNDVWALSYKDYQTCQVTKLNANGGFERVTTRSCQTFGTGGSPNTFIWACHQDGNELHIVWSDQCASSTPVYYQQYYYSLWNMSTETWTVENELVYALTDTATTTGYERGAVINKRSTDGQVIIFHGANHVTNGIYTRPGPAISRRTGTATWNTQTWNFSVTDKYLILNKLDSIALIEGASGRMHAIYPIWGTSDSEYVRIRHRSLSSSNVLDTEAEIYSNGTDNMYLQNESYDPVSYAVTTDQGNTYITIPVGTLGTVAQYTRILRFQSQANPSFTSALSTFAPAQGINEEYYFSGSSSVLALRPGYMWVSADGNMNLMRNEQVFNGQFGFPDDPDRMGNWIYYESDPTGTSFAGLRGHAGFWSLGGGRTTDYNEWLYPGTSYHRLGGAEFRTYVMGSFTRSSTEYVYGAVNYSSNTPGRSTALVYYVWALPEIPSVEVTHTVDMALSGTETRDHTVDMFIAGVGAATHSVDMHIIEQNTADHTVDQHIIEINTQDHTVDMVLTRIEDIVTDFASSPSVLATTLDVSTPPPIEGIGVLGGPSGTYYSASGGGGAGSGRVRYETGRKFVKKKDNPNAGN